MNKHILHLSHTDIVSDSRILKEIDALKGLGCAYKVKGIGIESRIAVKGDISQTAEIISIRPIARKFTYLPKSVQHFFTLVEVSIRMLVLGIKFKPDVVHCADNVILPMAVAIKIFSGSKLIYDAHELESDKNRISNLAKRLIYLEEKILWRFVDYLIVVSPSIKKWYLTNFSFKPSSIILNTPVFDALSFDNSDLGYFRKKYEIPDGCLIFLYIGLLTDGRGIDLIVEAFKRKSVTSHVVFLGYGDLYEELEECSSEYSNIHIHKAVDHHRVVEIARAADVGFCLIENVSLSDYYSLPNKLFEYIFAGVPVLASKFPDIQTLLEAYNVGRCCELSVNSIEQEVNKFQNSQRISVDAGDLVELSWAVQADSLVGVYEKLLS